MYETILSQPSSSKSAMISSALGLRINGLNAVIFIIDFLSPGETGQCNKFPFLCRSHDALYNYTTSCRKDTVKFTVQKRF